MTDITDQDRRLARGWATMMDKQIAGNPDARAAARVILATVEAPPLSEDLAHVTENWQEWATEAITTTLAVATDLAKQMEHELTEARAEVDQWKQVSRIETTTLREQRDEAHAEIVRGREIIRKRKEQVDRIADDRDEALAEVERLTAENEKLRRTDNYREFREQFLTVQKDAESNAENPDPADVKPGEAWIVDVDGERRTAVKDRGGDVPWNTVAADGLFFSEENKNVTLLHRLVPAPRVITPEMP